MEKKKVKSGAGKLAAIIVGVVDALLIVLLVLAFVVDPVKGGTAKVNLPGDFVQNADSYNEVGEAVEYVSAAEVVYGVSEQKQAETNTDTSAAVTDPNNPYDGFVFPKVIRKH